MSLKEKIIELYRKTATEMPEDIIAALRKAEAKEDENTTSRKILTYILLNSKKAKDESRPICQDRGTPIFYVENKEGHSQKELKKIIEEATKEATESIPLRKNSIDSLTEKNNGNRPIIHFKETDRLKIDLLLSGGGSENISAVSKLSNTHRNLKGVREYVLDSIVKVQGMGCPPYIIGLAIGGNIEEVAHLSKKQLLKRFDDKNQNPELEEFENKLLKDINQLGIGPAGLGGKTTALNVKIAAIPRHPTSFFVGISIGCWCTRRQNL